MSDGPQFKNDFDSVCSEAVRLIEKASYEAAQHKVALLEAYVRVFLEHHPELKIEDLTIVEQMKDGHMLYYLANKHNLVFK